MNRWGHFSQRLSDIFATGLFGVLSGGNSRGLDRCADLPQSPRNTVNGTVRSEKVLQELRSKTLETSGVDGADELGDTGTRFGAPTSIQGNQTHTSLRHENVGGLAFSGGRPGEEGAWDDFDQHSTSDGSTLPPPYSSHIGEWWVNSPGYSYMLGI